MSERESVRTRKCLNWKVLGLKNSELESVRTGKIPNWKVLELEKFRTGKCQNWKNSELESVRILMLWKVSELEYVRMYCYWILSEFETLRINKLAQKLSELEKLCQKKCQNFPVLTLSNSDPFRSWHFQILTLSNSDTFQFWTFQILKLSCFSSFVQCWACPWTWGSPSCWGIHFSSTLNPKHEQSSVVPCVMEMQTFWVYSSVRLHFYTWACRHKSFLPVPESPGLGKQFN